MRVLVTPFGKASNRKDRAVLSDTHISIAPQESVDNSGAQRKNLLRTHTVRRNAALIIPPQRAVRLT